MDKTASPSSVIIRVHQIVEGEWKKVAAELRIQKSKKRATRTRARLEGAVELLGRIRRAKKCVVVAGTTYGSSGAFVKYLMDKQIRFAVEIRPSDHVERVGRRPNSKPKRVKASELLKNAPWKKVEIIRPDSASSMAYSIAELGEVQLPDGTRGRVFAAQKGGIDGVHPGTIIGMTSVTDVSVDELLQCVGWARWIRPIVRRQERSSQKPPSVANGNNGSLNVRYRSNITLSRLQDESTGDLGFGDGASGRVFKDRDVINVAELFAGAGGMGLGFLMAKYQKKRCRLVFSGELHPIYVETLRYNHNCLAKRRRIRHDDIVPASVEPINLSARRTFDGVMSSMRESGGVDVLIGGPPCQGFSNANRNSWSSNNPQNQLVSVFMRYVRKLQPRVFLMENVQGIAWTAKDGRRGDQPSVADHVVKRMKAAGYSVFPKLLDAVWYGVPQFRTRLFLMGIHQDAGYHAEDFGGWGPYPIPTHGPATGRDFVTVREAIEDLPEIGNGQSSEELSYSECDVNGNEYLRLMRLGASRRKITDHVSSRHADYVIERYKRIPPGGNWQDIVEMMSNYARVDRTHSNIYRRLEWDEPSITIGHYRKSMLIHPEQDRGLSLREACRLQSFPDWFRFAGTERGLSGGLMHKQQQLANAVCPLLSKAITEFIMEL